MFITIFYTIKWALEVVGRMIDYFESARNETLRKGHEGRDKGREKE